jgi:flagellar biogenesis protein FliO
MILGAYTGWLVAFIVCSIAFILGVIAIVMYIVRKKCRRDSKGLC